MSPSGGTLNFSVLRNGIIEMVKLPSHLFLSDDFSEILQNIKEKMATKLNLEDFNLHVVKDNIFFFKITIADVSIVFSDTVCDFLGFVRGLFYNDQSLGNFFMRERHFMDADCDMIGLRTNFAYNYYLDRDCIGIFI